jgi:hypothetical protein
MMNWKGCGRKEPFCFKVLNYLSEETLETSSRVAGLRDEIRKQNFQNTNQEY